MRRMVSFCPLIFSLFDGLGEVLTTADWAGVSIDEFPKLKEWLFRMLARPGVEKGRHVPSHHGAFDKMSEEDKEKAAKATSSWVMAGNDHGKK